MTSLLIHKGRASALPLHLIGQAIRCSAANDLEALTERLIDQIDSLDPDPEAEDDTEDSCPASDDGCGSVWRHGYRCWESGHDHHGV